MHEGRLTKFAADWLDKDDSGVAVDPYPTFEGYTTGQSWNGWGCPYFTKEQADKVAAAWKHSWPDVPAIRYSELDDLYLVEDSENPGEFETFKPVHLLIDGVPTKVYAIGAFSWTWDQEGWHF